MVGDKPFLGVGFPPLKSAWISMATVEILFWQSCQISWLEEDADHAVLIGLQPLCQQSVMSFIEAAFSNYDMWILRTLPFDLALGVPVRRNETSARGEGLRDFCHWAPVRPVLDRVIRVSGTHSLPSSWAHHSGLRASTSADMLDLITATGWLDYSRHWLKYLDNFLLGDQHRRTPTFREHRHAPGCLGLPLSGNLLKVTHILTLFRLFQRHWARC